MYNPLLPNEQLGLAWRFIAKPQFGETVMFRLVVLTAAMVIFGLGFLAETAGAKVKEKIDSVDCDAGRSIQAAVDAATGPTAIFISGTCVEDISITADDITLSGNEAGASCNKANPGGTGTINGTVTVDGVRARIEFLTLTGSGDGIEIRNRADVRRTEGRRAAPHVRRMTRPPSPAR